jgi:CBS domain-containing protein
MMRSDVRPLAPDDSLDQALELFVENDVMTLPVVNDHVERKIVGLIRRAQISGAYVGYMHAPAVLDDSRAGEQG